MDAGIYTDVRRAAEGDSFLQLVTKKTRKVKRASPKQENAAQEVRRHFVQRVTKIFPDADLCSIIYSPHALIDTMNQYKDKSKKMQEIFGDVIRQGTFLFYELSDPWRLEDQWSFSEIYLNRGDIFRYAERDYTFALDFAIGLGVDTDTATFFSGTASFLEDDNLASKHLPKRVLQRVHRVQEIYQAVGNICDLTVQKLTSGMRAAVRQFMQKRPNLRNQYQLFQRLTEQLGITTEQLSGKLQVEHFYYGITTVEDLLRKVVRVFIQTMDGRTIRHAMLRDNRLSCGQIELLPKNPSIHWQSDEFLNTANIQQKIFENHGEIIKNLTEIDACLLYGKKTRLQYDASRFMLKQWPLDGFVEDTSLREASLKLRNIVKVYHDALTRIVYRKSKQIEWSEEAALQVCEFACNSNLFAIQANIPLAPLVVYSMLHSDTHQLRSFVSKPWNLNECCAPRPLSGKFTSRDRLDIGLYIRLRELFLSHLDIFELRDKLSADAISKAWDALFCDMTGYNAAYMIDTDGCPDSYAADRWRIERFVESWDNEIDFDIWGFPEAEPSHSEVFRWMKDQDALLENKSWNHYIDRQIKLHPRWLREYRQQRSLPWYNGFHSDFLSRCLKECKASEKSISVPEYPYSNDVARPFQLRGKYFPEMLLEEKLQTTMYKESQEKLFRLRDVLCRVK